MTNRFLKLMCTETFFNLLHKHPKALILLLHIATQTHREDTKTCKMGEASLEGLEVLNMTASEIRCARQVLIDLSLIQIVSTNKNPDLLRKNILKGDSNVTSTACSRRTKYTIVKITDTRVIDLNLPCQKKHNDIANAVTYSRLEPENGPSTDYINKKIYKENIIYNRDLKNFFKKPIAIENGQFDLSADEIDDLKDRYPEIDIQGSLAEIIDYIQSRPMKTSNFRPLVEKWLTNAVQKGKSNPTQGSSGIPEPARTNLNFFYTQQQKYRYHYAKLSYQKSDMTILNSVTGKKISLSMPPEDFRETITDEASR